jgi:hypothetical protein
MKKLLLFALLFASTFTFGQKQEVDLIQSSWGKEIIKLPFWFAPQIDYEGYEDIRFAKGWEDKENASFWATAFAWDANLETKLTSKFFEDNIKLYFDGLMKVVNEDSELTIPKTKVSLLENKTKKGIVIFIGTIEVYDAFTTKKMIKLNAIIESHYCKKRNKYVPLFKLSPKDFTHEIWKELKSIKLQKNICN